MASLPLPIANNQEQSGLVAQHPSTFHLVLCCAIIRREDFSITPPLSVIVCVFFPPQLTTFQAARTMRIMIL